MKLNLHIDQKVTANIRGKNYPVLISGTGIPCLVIGTGTHMQRTLSPRFKTHFKVYSSDLYWTHETDHSITFQQILADIDELAHRLNLSHHILMGHSAFGIVALEFAKKYPAQLKGVILIGTPPHSNPEIAKKNNAYFQLHAEPERKRIDAERQAAFAKEPPGHFLREYIFRLGPRYWHDPTFDCTSLWEGMTINDPLFHHFFADILPANNIEEGLDQIQCPIFLAAGTSDYDCCPLQLWSEVKTLPPHMIISRFEKSGHFPNYEEQTLFDKRIENWILEQA